MTIDVANNKTKYKFDVEQASAALPGPEWLSVRRKEYVTKFLASSMPTTDEEIWRYTDINSFDLEDYQPLSIEELGFPGEKKSPGGGVVAAEAGDHSALVIIRDGRVVHTSINEKYRDKGLVVTGIAEAQGEIQHKIENLVGQISDETSDAFVLLNEAMSAGGTFIDVPKSLVVQEPVVIVHWSEGENVAVFDRTYVNVEENASVSVIERFESNDQKMFISSITECNVGKNAQVKYLTTQENGKNTTHIGVHRTHVYRDGKFESSTVSLGGEYARLRGEVVLLESNASSDVMAVYYGDGNQLLDFRTLQDHKAPHTESNLLFKGAVEDNSRSVYSGMIHLREAAQDSRAYQTNRNLVLDHGAHAESIPNLMIEANDVKCSHGSTVGPIDEEQMYYLATRGVAPRDAERLIILGFFEDVFSRLSVPALIEPLRRSVNEKLVALSTKREEGSGVD